MKDLTHYKRIQYKVAKDVWDIASNFLVDSRRLTYGIYKRKTSSGYIGRCAGVFTGYQYDQQGRIMLEGGLAVQQLTWADIPLSRRYNAWDVGDWTTFWIGRQRNTRLNYPGSVWNVTRSIWAWTDKTGVLKRHANKLTGHLTRWMLPHINKLWKYEFPIQSEDDILVMHDRLQEQGTQDNFLAVLVQDIQRHRGLIA